MSAGATIREEAAPGSAPEAAVRPGGPGAPTRRGWVLPVHMTAAVLVQSTSSAAMFMMPYLAKQYFGAGEWSIAAVTAAPLVLQAMSVFWQPASRRMSPRAFLLVFWLLAFLPWGLAGAATSLWHLIVLHVVASVGFAAWWAISGEYLTRLYPAASRGRAFGLISMVVLGVGAAAGYGAGKLLGRDPEWFRLLLPLAAGLQLLGVLLLAWIRGRLPGVWTQQAAAPTGEAGVWRAVVEPVLHMREILRADRVFLRYEAAYMTYGVGWMIFWVLLPLIGSDRLGLGYDEYPLATQVPFQLVMLALMIPCGLLNDRIGPARVSALAFGLYTLFPLLLLTARDAADLTWACALWGVCSSAVHMGWTLGPVALAPTPEKAPQYLAIHATMVGLRGAVFQALGVGLLTLTGSFAAPLVVASLGFAWAAWQMWRLRHDFAERAAARAAGH